MFTYKIVWRLDDEEEFCTDDMEIKADSVASLSETIKGIEKDHTILSIINTSI